MTNMLATVRRRFANKEYRMIQRLNLMLLAATALASLAACGGTATAPAPTAAPVATAAPTAAPVATAAPEATAAPVATAAPAASTGGTRVFVIVPEQSEASYEVQEQFLNRNLPNMAVGKTKAISGELELSLDGQPTGTIRNISVDLRTLTSDSPRRDNIIRERWLESNKYPLATFVSTRVDGAPVSYTEGQEVSFKITGDMTIRDVTKPVTWDVTGKLQGDTITGTATTRILMKDFGFDPPAIAGVLTVQDGVTLKLTFTAKEKK
jgi:polyisoprenoid-binding protein YceI